MLYSPKPGAPPLPFPTAFPALGAYAQNPTTGQHASNPTPNRTYTLRPRRPHHKNAPRPHFLWYNNQYLKNGHPSVAQQDRLIQKWLTWTWKYHLTNTQRSQWAAFAAAYELTNVYGTTKFFSPFGAFIFANRAYIVGYAIPGVQPSHANPVRWPAPPATWPAQPTLTLTTPRLEIRPPYPPTLNNPSWYFYVNANWPTTGSGYTLQFYCSYPGKIISARRQGPMFLTFSATRGNIPYFKGNTVGWMYHPGLQIGQPITVAYLTRNDLTGGLSPLTWLNLTATTYP